MRLFLAIDLDEAARALIAREQKRIAAVLDRGEKALTWVDVDRMHLTLVFLGEVPDATAAGLVEAMAAPIAHAPFEIAFGGIGVFPPERSRKPPRVLWIGLANGVERTVAVQQTVVARLAAAGVPIEDRDFRPHLTLARWRRSVWSDRRRAAELAPAGIVARIHVECVTLFHSRLSSAGPSYTALARANLVASENAERR